MLRKVCCTVHSLARGARWSVYIWTSNKQLAIKSQQTLGDDLVRYKGLIWSGLLLNAYSTSLSLQPFTLSNALIYSRCSQNPVICSPPWESDPAGESRGTQKGPAAPHRWRARWKSCRKLLLEDLCWTKQGIHAGALQLAAPGLPRVWASRDSGGGSPEPKRRGF